MESTLTQSVDFPKSIIKFTIVGILYTLMKSQSSIMFLVGIIMYLDVLCSSYFCFDSSILRLKVMIEGKKLYTVDFLAGLEQECIKSQVYTVEFFRMSVVLLCFIPVIYLVNMSL